MIPVPDYLKQYASEENKKKNTLSFKLKCTCGCGKFTICENTYTEDEKQIIKEYEEKFPDTGLHSVYGGVDSDGKPYNYIKILGVFKKRIVLPKVPAFMEVKVIKAICSHCEKEIILFDSRYYGYDGMTSHNKENEQYIPYFKQKDNVVYSIEFAVENENSLEDFNERFGEKCTFQFYSNSFTWIRIDGLTENGKRKLLYDIETD